MPSTEVLIVGAGPTGLVLALWLNKLGVAVRLIDLAAQPGTTSRALAVHARTLELYRQLDLADAVLSQGHKVPAVNLWVRGKRKAHVAFEVVGGDLTPYPFMYIFPQDEHERLLIARLRAVGIEVERSNELLGFESLSDRVVARVRGAAGESLSIEAAFIAGCDGARSSVRTTMGTGFPGGTYRQVFYVADIEGTGAPMDGELHADLDEADFLAVFPLAGSGRARLIGTVRDERAEHAESLKFEDVSARALEHLQLQVKKVNWFSTYRVHHRVTDHFRQGHALLLGDAAHIHSPAGGQGMNTGIGDAINLAWKLKAVLRQRAPEQLLDSYESERQAFARRLVSTTDRIFTLATADGALADIIRTRVVPIVLPAVIQVGAWREWIFRTASQTGLHYRDSPLSAGHVGKLHGGDRLPWLAAPGVDNFAPLTSLQWQVQVYGQAGAELAGWCQKQAVALHEFMWNRECERAGFVRDTAYLLRPDTYIGLATPAANAAEALTRYFAERAISP